MYDVTDFLGAHPGGKQIILKHAGRDATKIFDSFHSADTINKYLKPELVYTSLQWTKAYLGTLQAKTWIGDRPRASKQKRPTTGEAKRSEAR